MRAEWPAFLAGAPDLAATFTWMGAERAAVAMLLESPEGWLLALVKTEHGRPRPLVVRLRSAPPEPDLPGVQALFAAPARSRSTAALTKARDALDRLGQWFDEIIVPVLRAALPAATTALLWSPHGVAAAVPLALVWPGAPPVWTTPCITLPPPAPAALRSSSALLILADPHQPGMPDAIPDAVETIAHIARSLTPVVQRVEVILGAGDLAGGDVAPGVVVPGLLTGTRPTPLDVCRRLREHRTVVVLAHGSYDVAHPEKSALLMLDTEGRPARLTADALAEAPDLLAGAAVVLLSCEAGAAGDLSAAPSGLAGVLLAVGAALVVAPLWPVLTQVALAVGKDVTSALGVGETLPAVLKRVEASLGHDPALAHAFDRGPFVVWTG